MEPGAVAQLSEALGRAIDDPALRRRLGAAAELASRDFDIEVWYERLGRIWADVAQRTAPDAAGARR